MPRLVRIALCWFVLLAGASVLATVTTLPAAAQSSGPTDIDHFTCYTASAPAVVGAPSFTPPAVVELQNQFAPNGFLTRVKGAVLHCNPAQKTVGGTVTPIVNPNTHLLCFGRPPRRRCQVCSLPTPWG